MKILPARAREKAQTKKLAVPESLLSQNLTESLFLLYYSYVLVNFL